MTSHCLEMRMWGTTSREDPRRFRNLRLSARGWVRVFLALGQKLVPGKMHLTLKAGSLLMHTLQF